MKKIVFALAVIVQAVAAVSAEVSNEFATAFFNRDTYHLKQTFAAPLQAKQTSVLREILSMMRQEEAATLAPVFAANGFAMRQDDLVGAIDDARNLKTPQDILTKEASRAEDRAEAARKEQARLDAIAKANKEKADEEARRMTQDDGRNRFDGGPVQRSAGGLGFEPEAGGWSMHGSAGYGEGKNGQSFGTYGAMGRYGVPIADGKLGNVGPEFGFIHAIHAGGHDEDLGSQQVYTSTDGDYRVIDYANREVHDSMNLFSIVGASYQTPAIAHDGRKIVNFEIGGRGGVGAMDNRSIRKDGEREEMVNYHTECSTWYDSAGYSHTTCHDVPYWDKMSDHQGQKTESGRSTTELFYTAFAAANVYIVDQLSLRLEVEKYFLNSFQTKDVVVGRAGLSWHF